MTHDTVGHDGAVDLEIGIARLVAVALDLTEPPDGDATLTHLGLGSLQAARLWLDVQDTYGIDFPFSWLTGELTVRQLCAAIAGADRSSGAPNEPVGSSDEPFPLTGMQQSYVAATAVELTDDPVGCHQYLEFSVDDLDTDRLAAAWRALVDHHDMLRTVVTQDGVQRILTVQPSWSMPVHDLKTVEPGAAHRAIEATRQRLRQWHRDPQQWPPFAIEASLLADGTGVVHVDIDGLVADGHAIALLLEQWHAIYHDATAMPTGTQLRGRDGVLAMTAAVSAQKRERDLAYWCDRLSGAPNGPAIDALPRIGSDLTSSTASGQRFAIDDRISAQDWAAARAAATTLGVSPSSLALAVFADALTRVGIRAPFSVVLTTSARAWLPREAEHVVGPFTSSAVVTAEPNRDRDIADVALDLHRQVWSGLEHSAVSGVDVGRELRSRRQAGPQGLSVVFTSLLGFGPGGRMTGGFGADVTEAVCRTSGVLLDNQIWEDEDGALCCRWDYRGDHFPTGWISAAMALFCNGIRSFAVVGGQPAYVQANALQQAYLVERSTTDDRWDGCQIYKSVDLPAAVALEQVRTAVADLVAAHPLARSWIDADGRVFTGETGPCEWTVAVVDLDEVADPDGVLNRLRSDLVGRAFPLGRWPHFDIRLTRRAGATTLHCAFDIAVFDAPAVHMLVRDLVRRCTNPNEYRNHRIGDVVCPAATVVPAGTLDIAAAREHWRSRAHSVPDGPVMPSGPRGNDVAGGRLDQTGDQPRVRLSTTVAGWRRLASYAAHHDLLPDALLLAVFTQILAAELGDDPFAVPVVRWVDAGAVSGAATALSWIVAADPGVSPAQAAVRMTADLREDAAADAVSGLDALRRRVLRAGDGGSGFPIVYSCVVDLSPWPMPVGARESGWRSCTPGVALDCVATVDGDDLSVAWDADPQAFPAGWLGSAFARFSRGVDRLVADPGQPALVAVDRGPLSDVDFRTVVYGFNDTARDFLTDRLVHDQFEATVRRQPNAVAVRTARSSITFEQLNASANRIAARLRAHGVAPGTMVGVRVRRDASMIAAVLGVVKAGAAYVPVEPHLPAGRAATMLTQARAAVVVSTADTVGWPVPPELISIETDAELAGDDDPGNPARVAQAESTAYVIFTSGSTGSPKGVAVSHRAVSNLLSWCMRRYPVGPADIGLCVTSLGFDLSVYDIFGVLGAGASLYVADSEEQHDPASLLDVVLREGVTFWNSAPTTLSQVATHLAECTDTARTDAAGGGRLRLVFLSGDYTPLSLPDTLRATFPGVRVVSLGGATEATVWSNHFEVGAIDPQWRSIPYGVPIDNSRYYVLDDESLPCPVGIEGDLYIAGECLAQGYHNAPQLTNERFVPDPYAIVAGQLMYRTGDRAAYGDDGIITFLGRRDGQVKIRGFRVELGEIEHRIRQHPGVRDVVVVARGEANDRKVVAYVIPSNPVDTPTGAGVSVRQLREHAAQTLPDYMVPNFVAFLHTFPATANGKLDRAALPWPLPASGVEVGPAPAAPNAVGRTEQELRGEIAGLFAGLLGVDAIDPDADIWDQGATSFTMVQVSNAMHRTYQHRIPISVVLADPTASGIARYLAAGVAATAPATTATASATTTAVSATSAAVPATAPAVRASAAAPVLGPQVVDEVPAVLAVSAVGVVSAGSEAGPPPQLEFFSASEREQFKAEHRNVRPATARTDSITLPAATVPVELYRRRSTRRRFASEPLPIERLASLMALLQVSIVDGKKRRLYPSAGDTYAVQTYLHVKHDRIVGVAGGVYYYRPETHALERLGDASILDRSVHFYYNRTLYDEAGFELYFVGQTRAIAPIYGTDADRYLALEAGHISQLLSLAQAELGLALCQIGALAFDRLRPAIDADDGHVFLLGYLCGGSVDESATPLLFAPEPAAPEPAVSLPTASQLAALPAAPASAAPLRPADERSEIAIVGMSGRFPGADDADELWENLLAGRRALSTPPKPRAYAGGQADLVGGYLPAVDEFDSLLFHISPTEARTVDPQLRLALTSVWQCLENAGHTPESLRCGASRVGVFVAAMWHDYELVGAEAARNGGVAEAGSTASDIANRISHYFGLRGPSIAVDTSCSSTLTAVHLAAQSIRHGDCDAAVVFAVNLMLHPYHADLLRSWGLVADSPVAGAFDASAAGWSPGEGYGSLLLRRWPEAAADGDRALATIAGTWISHGGHAGRFGVPAVAGLTEAMRDVLAHCGMTAHDIGYVECAAAGASVADSAELEALAGLLGDREDPVPIGTVKHNIGHLEAAAGMSQLAKVVLQLHHNRIAPTPVSDDGPTLIALSGAPVRVVTMPEPWEGRRVALVNAVGAGGSSAHVLLRPASNAPMPDRGEAPTVAGLVPLSAASAQALTEMVVRLRERIAVAAPSLADVAFTLQTGRAALRCRLLVSCVDVRELCAVLDAVLAGRTDLRARFATVGDNGINEGRHADRSASVGRVGGTGATVGAIGAAWLAGEIVDWTSFWPTPANRIALPTYPFARVAHWLSPTVVPTAGPVAIPARRQPADQRGYTQMLGKLVEAYARVSAIPVDLVDPRAPLEHLGLNSSLVVRMVAELNGSAGALRPEMFFECRTLAELAETAAARGGGEVAAESVEADVARPFVNLVPTHPGPADMAIIGIAGRYPGAANVDELWARLVAGYDAISDLPARRHRPDWPVEMMKGAFLDDVDRFDPLLFGIAPRDADLMDPQERLFLEVVWETLDDAGYPRIRLREAHGGRVGVFAATMYSEYPFFGVEQSLAGTPMSTDSSIAGIANRVSYALDLRGPSLTVDSMCSASLTALHVAITSLRAGECELAIVGGVNLSLHPNKFIEQARLRMTSSDHRCRAFGEGGDGFAPGEGVGAVLLKPLASALADGDRVHAIIRGSAINHGGRTNGYTVPDPAAQADVIRQALAKAGAAAATIGYVEAHGTGTKLGDPVEISGLERVFSPTVSAGGCRIGSIKSNIGHCEGAAGIAGLTKVVLQLRHRTLVPTLHVEQPNTGIDWDRSPFRLQTSVEPWLAAAGQPRRACLSSFGAGGSNAHVVIEEAAQPSPSPSLDGAHLFVVSARDDQRLRAAASRLAAAVSAGSDRLADIAHTLQIGREPLACRLAIVAVDREDVVEALSRYAAGNTEGIHIGRATRVQSIAVTAPVPANRERVSLDQLAEHWVRGHQVDWATMYPAGSVRIVGLPSYPFAAERHWITAERRDVAVYRTVWRPAQQPTGQLVRGVLLCLHAGHAQELRAKMSTAFGPDVRLMTMDVSTDPEFANPDAAAQFGHALITASPDLVGLIDMSDLGPRGWPSWRARVALLRELAASRRALRAVHVVSGLYHAGAAEPTAPCAAPDDLPSPVAGLVWALSSERSALSTTVVDVDVSVVTEQVGDSFLATVADSLHREWSTMDAAARVCYRDGRRLLPQLLHQDVATGVPHLDPGRCYLITGGTGGLGAVVARHLVSRGAKAIALLGQRPMPDRSTWDGPDLDDHQRAVVALVRDVEVRGARVALYTASLDDDVAVRSLVDRVRAELGPIGGLVHCAGRMARVGSFAGKSVDDIDRVLAPKVDGTHAVVEACLPDSPAFMVFFSSLAGSSPVMAAGVAEYAAANAYLDSYASWLVRAGHSTVSSIAWPSWGELGMTGGTDAGSPAITVTDALAVLDAVIAYPAVGNVAVVPAGGTLDLAISHPGYRLSALNDGALAKQVWQPIDLSDHQAHVMAAASPVPDWLVEVFAITVGMSRAEVDVDTPFADLGINSILIADLVVAIEARLGCPVPPSALLEHPTLAEFASYVGGLVGRPDAGVVAPTARATPLAPTAPAAPLEPVAPVAPVVPVALNAPAALIAPVAPMAPAHLADAERVAVVGLSCQFPGAPDAGAFWDLLRHGRCAVEEVPASRWDVDRLYHTPARSGMSISRWGGYVSTVELFDPQFFGMSDEEAITLDPGIRLLLETVAMCLADAGHQQDTFDGSDVGVFVGARLSDYRRRVGARSGASAFGGDQNFLAARLAQQWNLTGPNMVVDSACSSALVAVQLAMRSILAGESRTAVVGGVEVLLDEHVHVDFTAAGALSPSGRCRAFDRSADGFVPGEGCGVLLLKRLDHALTDGDRIWAVIDAVAVGNDGRTIGLTTPNPKAQAAVVRRAMRAARVHADEIAMIEAHGTGTMIGDPIELQALTTVFREDTDQTGYCAIGSVKSNVGHLLSAAGMAGLIKAILAVHHGEIPPTLFCDEPNPRFDFATSPFVPAHTTRQWAMPASQRVAGVSAFGLGGTNAHAIVRGLANNPVNNSAGERRPAAPPVFSRRRLWLDASGGSPGEPESPPVAVDDPLVASLLSIAFDDALTS